nr:DNA mismatch repair protein MSH7 isoform X2 [Ipomoea batatas]
MKRQSSILSFLKKPSPEDQRSGGATLNGNQPTHLQHNKNAPPPTKCAVLPATLGLTEEPKGTDTPPEKVPRQIFPTNDDGSGTKPSVFDSIKHKFVKFHNGEKFADRNLTSGGTLMMSSVTGGSERSEVHGDASLGSKLLAKENAVGFNRTIKQGDNGCSSVIVINDDAPGPETPGTRPLVPRLKRVQEDAQGLQDKGDCSALNMNKRVKTLQDSITVRKNLEEVSEMTSKFEWLHPSRIKDANGRRPGDPSFDKNTLYIPPDALRKMSASQKQYWGVKCRYMDVVLFFKVGKFYELYELDADIGHKELDWKITMSGVGKCRQVGISESGIDDAVQKLLARGYKVGRIEQLETSEQAKSRGSTSVIQRKLVNVLTPATSSEGNIGPDAVHLLSIKERCLDMEKGSTAFGFAFVDCAALKFWVGSISDDASCAALGSLLMQISAKEVIYDSRGLSKEAQKALKKYSLTGTLYKYLDNCITSSGKRLLRSWICHPLKDVDTVNLRLNVVEELMTHSETMSFVAQYFRKLPDLERLLGRVKASNQSSAELLLPTIGRKLLKQRKEEQLSSSLSKVFRLPVLHGNDGLHKFLTQFEAAIDSDFPNYQDHDITESDAETLSILMELFIEKATEWSQVIYAIGCVDVLRSFAVTATFSTGAMCRPIILPLSESTNLSYENKGPVLEMKGLWHPYALGESEGLPVPNDLQLGGETDYDNRRTLLLTGPNMGGKSTLLRATCLAVVMAQMGCYVPCEAFTLSLVDIIFTRLGATDRIMTGESTFFIECRETASVLQNATQNSLVLLDELGRGTSTFDGYAIAYAVFRHFVEIVNCRLLFATHYHALTKEFGSHPHVILKHMACSFKSNQKLVFLYRLASGACPESYGMQVALMAGIPKQVVESASKAGKVMKTKIGESFRSSEQRSSFSTLHEEWLKSLVLMSKSGESELDEDTFDTLFCMWHELRSSDGFLNSAASHQ